MRNMGSLDINIIYETTDKYFHNWNQNKNFIQQFNVSCKEIFQHITKYIKDYITYNTVYF